MKRIGESKHLAVIASRPHRAEHQVAHANAIEGDRVGRLSVCGPAPPRGGTRAAFSRPTLSGSALVRDESVHLVPGGVANWHLAAVWAFLSRRLVLRGGDPWGSGWLTGARHVRAANNETIGSVDFDGDFDAPAATTGWGDKREGRVDARASETPRPEDKEDESAPERTAVGAATGGAGAGTGDGDGSGAEVGEFTPNVTEAVESFDDMGLRDDVLRGIFALGFERPSPIQGKAVLPLLKGRDTIAQAQSGTGKTGAFSIAALQLLDPSVRATQVLIVSPTRELARQSHSVLSSMGEYVKGLTVQLLVGGGRVGADRRALRDGAHVVIATPGRLLHMLRDGALQVRDVRLVVLDEADEMLDEGFRDDMHDMMRSLPRDVQVALFSATLPTETMEVARLFMRDPAVVLVKAEQLTLDGIRQFYVGLDNPSWKLDVLLELFEALSVCQSIIFANTRREVDFLAEELGRRDFTCGRIHGDMEPEERTLVMKEFRSGTTRVLIASDVLARGIDVQSVSLVVNYALPPKRENYIHRIGRSGRWGRKGLAINLLLPRDVRYMRDIERFYATEVKELPQLDALAEELV
mmetsp:Transcript_83126/g.201479  ORF Transcript_83126/g.201479 Transcript_83126/m.201479 type:complete len:581 (-) Transcript_83126:57-1799(-)